MTKIQQNSQSSVLSPQSSVLSPQSTSGTEAPQSSNHQARLLITGGCGFIGTNLIDFMLKKGFAQFRILDNLSVGQMENLETLLSEHAKFEKKEESNRITYSLLSPQSSALSPKPSPQSSALSPKPLPQSSVLSTQSSSVRRIELIIGDIRNLNDCLTATENVDAVVHLAAQSGVPTSVEDPLHDCETNVIGTLYVLEACRRNSVDKFIFASSGAPLGEVEPPIHEEKVPHPVSPYGASKLAGEAYCSAYYKTFGIKTVALRFGNVYGPRSNHKSSVVAKFFKRAMEGLPLEIYGDGTQTRDFIFIHDLCNAIFLALEKISPQSSVLSPQSSRNAVAGQIFQIATFKETTVSEIAEKIKVLVDNEDGKKVWIIYGEKRIGDVERNYSDISKAIDFLGFLPQYNLDTGLNQTWKFFREQSIGTN